MLKRISGFFIAVMFAMTVFMSSFIAVSADNYKNWLQSDSRWRYKTLGGSGDTMAEIGCAVTAVAIQVVHSGSKSESEFNPGILVDYLNKSGGLDSEGNLYWGAVTGLVSSFTFEKRAYLSSQSKSNIIKELTNYINSGYYIVLSVEYDCHWVAIDTISNGTVYMMDPAQNKTNDLFNYYSAGGMLQVRLYKGKNTPPKAGTTTTAPTETLPPTNTTTYLTGHYKTTDPLNLRASYSTSSNTLLTIPEGAEIVVTRVYNNSWGETEYNGKSGWVYMGYTKYTEGNYTYKEGKYKCIADGGVNMRSGIGTDKSIVCLIPENAFVNISTVSHNWGKASYGSYTGYICMEYLEFVSGTAVTTTAATTTKAVTTTTQAVTTTASTAAATTQAVTTAASTAAATTQAVTTAASTAAATTQAITTATSTAATTQAVTTTASTAAATTQTVTTAANTAAATTQAITTAASTAAATTQAVTTTPVSGVTPATTASILKGDINRDGKLDKDDVLKLNLYIIDPVKIDFVTSFIFDINSDGEINEIDVVYLMKKIKKLGAITK